MLAPESANNAKEGGSFVPTLSFGIPGSSGMALVIGILLVGQLRSQAPAIELSSLSAQELSQLIETLSYQRGRHNLKTGFDFSHINHNPQALPLHFGGRYIFAPLPAIPALGLPAPVTAIQALALGLHGLVDWLGRRCPDLDPAVLRDLARLAVASDRRQRALLQRTRGRVLAHRDAGGSAACMANSYRDRMLEISDIMAGRAQR